MPVFASDLVSVISPATTAYSEVLSRTFSWNFLVEITGIPFRLPLPRTLYSASISSETSSNP